MNFPDLVTPVRDYKVSQYRNTPCHTNRASSIGGDCERELVYARTRWQEATTPPPELIEIFQEGDIHEIAVLHDLRKAGLRVYEQQTSLAWPEYQITGHIDATVADDTGDPVPVDVKTMSAHIWDSVFYAGSDVYEWSQVEDRFQAKPWLRKYRAQITLYCLMKGAEAGILLCKNKGTGALAQVNVPLDYDYGEKLLQRTERINRHVIEGSLPDRIVFDDQVCPRCPFYHLCLPSQQDRPPIAFVDAKEIESLLELMAADSEAAQTYKRADARVKAWAKEQESDRMVVGNWLLQVRQQKNGKRVEISPLHSKAG